MPASIEKFLFGPPDADFLERLRHVIGPNVSQFAKKVGVPVRTVQQYKDGRRPSIQFLAAIRAKFGLTIDWLVTGLGPIYVAQWTGERPFEHASEDSTDVALSPATRVIDPELQEVIDWADADPDIRGAILYIKEKEIRPYAEKKLAERSAALEPPASKAG